MFESVAAVVQMAWSSTEGAFLMVGGAIALLLAGLAILMHCLGKRDTRAAGQSIEDLRGWSREVNAGRSARVSEAELDSLVGAASSTSEAANLAPGSCGRQELEGLQFDYTVNEYGSSELGFRSWEDRTV